MQIPEITIDKLFSRKKHSENAIPRQHLRWFHDQLLLMSSIYSLLLLWLHTVCVLYICILHTTIPVLWLWVGGRKNQISQLSAMGGEKFSLNFDDCMKIVIVSQWQWEYLLRSRQTLQYVGRCWLPMNLKNEHFFFRFRCWWDLYRRCLILHPWFIQKRKSRNKKEFGHFFYIPVMLVW